ncbi:UNVERIFIED_CONTAM: hypothetical protein Sradi_3195400 [Sesamum radiatum]|uniref:Uncharacterized protein n=1 Tax=Sesamum radiatum TaxID=300843 RepID=A0AAW2RFV4_SESRA
MELGDVPLEPVDTSLYGFAGEVLQPLGQIPLPISLGVEPPRKTRIVCFLVVDMPSAYNLIFGRPTLNVFQAIISTYHVMLKFLVGNKIGEIQRDHYTARKFYVEAKKNSMHKMEVDTPSPEDHESLPAQEAQRCVTPTPVQPAEELMSIQLVPGEPEKTTKIGSQLNPTLAR